ncbi:MAG: hypothetical protein WC117_00325 [Sphaerochaetaceae bacterium]|jgi:hypothetical protein
MNLIKLAKLLGQHIAQGKGEYQVAMFQREHGSEPVTEIFVREVADIVELYSSTVPFNEKHLKWARRDGYECSTKGDPRFSALNALMPDGRTIEMWYQCDIKGYDVGGRDWKLGKGKPPLFPYPDGQLWLLYLNLWRVWAIHNSELLFELVELAEQHKNTLSDCFASTPINQAHALCVIANEWIINQ